MGLSINQLITLQFVTSISSLLSIFGCLIVLFKLYTSNPIWNVTNKQLLVLCLIDLITAIFWGFGQYGHSLYYFCQVQVRNFIIYFIIFMKENLFSHFFLTYFFSFPSFSPLSSLPLPLSLSLSFFFFVERVL